MTQLLAETAPRRPVARPALADWATVWAPYDDDTYAQALGYVRTLPAASTTVLDIGAGDLRFARQLATHGYRVLAIEQQAALIEQALRRCECPPNMLVIVADAVRWPFPRVDVAVLLMQYTHDYAAYVQKLRAVGCQWLITNARWRLGVECIPLSPAAAFDASHPGPYACVRCGHTGFVDGPPEFFDRDHPLASRNVETCPNCPPAAAGGQRNTHTSEYPTKQGARPQ
jgi:hypothetical protein